MFVFAWEAILARPGITTRWLQHFNLYSPSLPGVSAQVTGRGQGCHGRSWKNRRPPAPFRPLNTLAEPHVVACCKAGVKDGEVKMQTKRQKGGLCDNHLEVTAWFVRTGELFRRPILEILTLTLERLPVAKCRSRTRAKQRQ